MSAIDIAVFKLVSDDRVQEIVGRKVFPILAPQAETPPYVTIHLIDEKDIGATVESAGRYYRSIIQADCLFHGETDGAASKVLALGGVVTEALNGVVKESVTAYQGSYTDVDILLGSGSNTDYDLDRNSYRFLARFDVTWRALG